MGESEQFIKLCDVIDTLLSEDGCAWDRAQTIESLRPNLLEESYEVADAIDNNDKTALREELGDMFLPIIMISRIAEKDGHFSLADVLTDAAEKLVRRHTHIFGGDNADTPEDVIDIWESNKNKEKSISTPFENMMAVPKALPALARAQKVLKRSGKEFSILSLKEELIRILNEPKMENDGKILLLMAALLTKMQINAEFSLTKAVQEFINNSR